MSGSLAHVPLLFFFFFFYESSVWLLVRGSPSSEAALWKRGAARRRALGGQVATPRLEHTGRYSAQGFNSCIYAFTVNVTREKNLGRGFPLNHVLLLLLL